MVDTWKQTKKTIKLKTVIKLDGRKNREKYECKSHSVSIAAAFATFINMSTMVWLLFCRHAIQPIQLA